MYYISQKELLFFILYSFAVGFFLGAVYDVFRIIRLSRHTGALRGEGNIALHGVRACIARFSSVLDAVFTFFEDLLFFIVCGAVVSVMIYHLNSGRFRGIALLFVLLGFILYYFTVGRLIFAIADKILKAIRTVFGFVWKYTFGIAISLYKALYLMIAKIIYKKHLTNRTKSYIKIMYKKADKGFIE